MPATDQHRAEFPLITATADMAISLSIDDQQPGVVSSTSQKSPV